MAKRERTFEELRRIEEVTRVAAAGDLLTHVGCMGVVQEHWFTGWDGAWMRGEGTSITVGFGGGAHTDDISALNVTHINRVPVDDIADWEKHGWWADRRDFSKALFVF